MFVTKNLLHMNYTYDSDAELIRFLYGETTPEAESRIREELRTDLALREKWQGFKEVLDALNSKVYRPSGASVNIVLDHAREALASRSEEELPASW
jgi:hypothetical protein